MSTFVRAVTSAGQSAELRENVREGGAHAGRICRAARQMEHIARTKGAVRECPFAPAIYQGRRVVFLMEQLPLISVSSQCQPLSPRGRSAVSDCFAVTAILEGKWGV